MTADATALSAYRARLQRVPARDPEALAALMVWCGKNGLGDAMRELASKVVRIDPDHAAARRVLGHQKVGRKWLPEAEAKRALGFVQYRGRWRLPREVTYLKKAARRRELAQRVAEREAREHAHRTEAQIKRHYTRLAGSSENARKKAREQLVELARAERIPGLEKRALADYFNYRDGWAAIRRARRAPVMGLMSINLHYSKLIDLKTVPVSFGNGTTGRLQLPTVRSFGIGTTVAVPMGIR